jgi:hypothetical protein
MEELFNPQLPDGQRPQIQLCVFLHLREFLAIDLREETPRVMLLDAGDVFVEEFFKSVEAEFSEVLREETEFPFAHFINLPLRLEEVIRETAMTFILERLGILLEDEEQIPSVIVFVISGGALTTHSEQVVGSLRDLLKAHSGESTVAEWEETISRLVAEENQVMEKLNLNELTEALRSDSPDYFTLWENRN